MKPPDPIVRLLALLTLLLHVAVNIATPYGVHRDEFLYMAMGRHLRLWRMDFPPFIAIAADASRLFGDSLVALRIAPAIAAALLVLLAGMLARRFGGGAAAQRLAAGAVLASPLFLRTGSLFQPVVLDQLWWTLGYLALAALAARVSDDNDTRRWWMALGVVMGMGLLTKFSIAFFGLGAVAGILGTPLRRDLRTRCPWVALVIALAIGSPSITGQIALHFPVVGQMHDLQSSQLQRVTPTGYVKDQLLYGPIALLAVGGMVSLLAGRLRAYRAIGIATGATWLLLLAMHGKAYYVGPVYPVLGAAGAVALEQALVHRRATVRHLTLAGAWLLVVAFGALTLPFGLPILPPPMMARYAAASGQRSAVTTNAGQVEALPQDYADMLGWPAQTAAMVRAWHALTPAEQRHATVAAGNYGEAGALDFHGARAGLPATVSSAGSYWFFGPGTRRGEPTLVLADRRAARDLGGLFRSVRVVDSVQTPDHQWLVPEERDVVVFRCDSLRMPLAQAWASLAGRN